MRFDPPFPIGHLHADEQQRIRAGNLNSQELAMLAKGEDPWAKFREPQAGNSVTKSQALPFPHFNTDKWSQEARNWFRRQREAGIEYRTEQEATDAYVASQRPDYGEAKVFLDEMREAMDDANRQAAKAISDEIDRTTIFLQRQAATQPRQVLPEKSKSTGTPVPGQLAADTTDKPRHTRRRRKSERESGIAESRKRNSWIHRIPVWKEFGHWLKWASACFAFAVAMTQVNEYAWALAGLVGCGFCCLAQIYVWTASPNRFKNGITKLFLAFISLIMILVSGLTVLNIKGDKSWSNLISVSKQATLPKPISSTELKSLPRFNNFMLEPRPIHDGGYLIYKVVHPADLSPIEFYARLGILNPEDVRVIVYVVRPYQVSLVAATIAQHYETIVEQLKAQAKEKGFLDIDVSRTVVIHVDLGGGEPITIPKEARQKGINFEIERRLL